MQRSKGCFLFFCILSWCAVRLDFRMSFHSSCLGFCTMFVGIPWQYVCPTLPQNRHKLFAKQRACLAAVNLPYFPILSSRSDIFLSELWDDVPESHGTNCFFWCLFWLLFEEEEDCWFCDLLAFSKADYLILIESPLPNNGHQFVELVFEVLEVWWVSQLATLHL